MSTAPYAVQHLSEADFYESESEWQDLLRRSDGDPLFNSWYWASEWWRSRSTRQNAAIRLAIVVVVDSDGRWIGLAPSYLGQNEAIGIRTRCLHMIGSGLPGGNLFRAEFRSLLIDRAHMPQALSGLMQGINDVPGWNEALFSDVPVESMFYRHYRESVPTRWFSREINPENGHHVSLEGGVDDYRQGLRSSARRQMFNKRKRLAALGNVHLRKAPELPLADTIETLNRFHLKRFSQDIVGSDHQEFLERLTAASNASRLSLSHSMLCVDDRAVSVLLDIDAGGRRYNIQLGFDEDFDASVSLGVLHLGYAIEGAAEDGLGCYDMLIGTGLQEDYKTRYGTGETAVRTLHWVRSPWLRWLHRNYARLKRRT